MRRHGLEIVTLLLFLAGACGASPKPRTAAPEAAACQGLKIHLVTIYVDDQDKALRFYTDVLGLAEKDDVTNGPYRWLTVTSAEDPEGTELQLALDNDPAAKAWQSAQFQKGQPAVMFFTDDVKGDYERIKERGGAFAMAPTEVTGSTIAQLNDSCGNLIQITQLARW